MFNQYGQNFYQMSDKKELNGQDGNIFVLLYKMDRTRIYCKLIVRIPLSFL